ncbi:hypothetical protein [Paraburkholderia sp. SIMBA_030]|uniref:hypothetical protein n=1 Tax=Paraburkholderia sp. SIMBA_030 TaxID=3085773 RepID=UPI00397E739F
MDDRFDRRELLLHLGDMLDALSCLARTSEPGALVTQLAQGNDSLQNFEFLRALSPDVTVAAFSQGVASAFCMWPRELLEAELNRDALASSVQRHLFSRNVDGWNAYISYVQKQVTWFGTGLSGIEEDSVVKPSHDAEDEAWSLEAPLLAKPAAALDVAVRNEKRGWPWPEPRSTS